LLEEEEEEETKVLKEQIEQERCFWWDDDDDIGEPPLPFPATIIALSISSLSLQSVVFIFLCNITSYILCGGRGVGNGGNST